MEQGGGGGGRLKLTQEKTLTAPVLSSGKGVCVHVTLVMILLSTHISTYGQVHKCVTGL